MLVFSGSELSAAKDWSERLKTCKSLEDNEPQQAIDLAEASLSEVSRKTQTVVYGELLGCAAWAAVGFNKTDVALGYASQLDTLARTIEDSDAKVDFLRRSGSVFHRLGNRVVAIDNYQRAMDLSEALNLKKPQIPILVNLGVLFSQMKEEELAISNYRRAIKLMAEQNDFSYHAPVLFNLALTLKGQQLYKESLPVFQQIENMMTAQWPNQRKAQVYGGLASVNMALKQFDQARMYNQKALEIFSGQTEKPTLYYLSLLTQAELRVQEKRIQQAVDIAEQVWQHFQRADSREQLMSINNPLYALSNVYEAADQPRQALAVRKLATEIDNEFQDSFNKEAMAQMQARLSDSQQRKQLAELKIQQTKNQIELISVQHNRQLILLLVAFAAMLVVIYLYWQRQTNKRLHAISIRDSLTHLGNRRAIDEWLTSHAMPEPPNQRLLWLIDLDLFKEVNDHYGHEAGDKVLKALARTLSALTNQNRLVARWGGEEFMFITDDISAQQRVDFCDEIMAKIAATTVSYQGQHIAVTASVGVCEIRAQNDKAWHRALSKADKALYQAKEKGRNCTVCGDSEVVLNKAH